MTDLSRWHTAGRTVVPAPPGRALLAPYHGPMASGAVRDTHVGVRGDRDRDRDRDAEVLEARWKAGPDVARDLWQGLALICVGLTHAARGNHVGAVRLLERGAARLEEYDGGDGSAYGLDLRAVVTCARKHADTAGSGT